MLFYEQLTQEKVDLREEKASLKSDIENLNIQYQQRIRTMYPWVAMEHSVVMAPTSYPFPMPVTMPPGPIPLHPSMQPYPFFGNQNPAVIHNPCSNFVPFMTPNTLVDQQSTQHAPSRAQPATGSHVSGKQDSKNKSSGESKIGKSLDSNDDVTTELELKTPGSTTDQVGYGLLDLFGKDMKNRNHYHRYFVSKYEVEVNGIIFAGLILGTNKIQKVFGERK